MGEAARQYAATRSWEASLAPVYGLYRAASEHRLPTERLERTGAWPFRALAGALVSSLRRRSVGQR